MIRIFAKLNKILSTKWVLGPRNYDINAWGPAFENALNYLQNPQYRIIIITDSNHEKTYDIQKTLFKSFITQL